MTVAVSIRQEQTEKILPKGWQWVKLEDVCSQDRQAVIPGTSIAASLPYLGLEHIESNTGKILYRPSEMTQDEGLSNTFKFTSSHILYGKLRPYLNKVAIPNFSGKCTTEAIPLLPKSNINREYLAWALRRQEIVNAVMQEKTGSRMPRADMNQLLSLYIPLPPIEEQRRIVAILNEKMEAIAVARKATLAQIEAAEALPAAYLRQVFDSPEAQKWERKKLGDIAKTCSGSTPSRKNKDYYIGTIPWVKTGELLDGKIIKAEEHISDMALQETSVKLLPSNTLLIAMYGQGKTRGRTGLLSIPATTNQACFAILPNDQYFTSEYLQLWFRYNYYRLREMTEGRGGNQPNLNGQLLRDLVINLPTLEKQKSITTQLNKSEEQTIGIIQSLHKQLKAINALPAAILRQAFNGEL